MFKKINDESIELIPALEGGNDTRPIKGAAMFPELFANVFICAKKKSGKTNVIYNILKKCCGPETKVLAFVSTINKDEGWIQIKNYCDHVGIYFEGHTSLLDEEGSDILDTWIEAEQKPTQTEDEPQKVLLLDDSPKKKPKRSKFRSPEWIIVLDDISTELKAKSVNSLLKKNRHLKCKVIISSQYLNDLLPMSRKQLDYVLLFGGHGTKKLEEIYRDVDVSVPFEQFARMYRIATADRFNFLYVDTRGDKFRKNFNMEFN